MKKFLAGSEIELRKGAWGRVAGFQANTGGGPLIAGLGVSDLRRTAENALYSAKAEALKGSSVADLSTEGVGTFHGGGKQVVYCCEGGRMRVLRFLWKCWRRLWPQCERSGGIDSHKWESKMETFGHVPGRG